VIRDVGTVLRKEWLEILDQFVRFKRGGWSVILALVFLGVFLPLQIGPSWAMSPLMFFYWPFLTASMTSTIVTDAVAGERERHTLETLLATRLGDSSILLGKLLASVTYGYAFALTNLGIGLVAVLIAYGADAERMTAARFAALLCTLGAAASCISGLGVFVSLRAGTVRQAQQMFGIAMLGLMLVPVAALPLLPQDARGWLMLEVARVGPEGIAWRVSAVLAVLAAVLVVAAVRRFKRGRLPLE
jgi:ABC-2 type transport system permease protein